MLIFNVIRIKCIEFKRAIFSMMLLLLLFSNYFLTLSQSCVLLFGIHYKETFPILQEKSEHASYMCLGLHVCTVQWWQLCCAAFQAVWPKQEIISISFFWVFENTFCFLYMKILPNAEINSHVQLSATSSCAFSTNSTGLEWDEENGHFTGCKKKKKSLSVAFVHWVVTLWNFIWSFRPGQSLSTYVFRT